MRRRWSRRSAAIAGRSYRLGRANTLTLLLDSSSPDVFLERVQRLDMMAQCDGRTLAQYREDLGQAQQAKAAIDREVAEQQKQVAALTKKKKEAELALASIGGGGPAGGFVDANSPLAKPAPRNSDGSWPKESCTVNDPTTTGCITPRMLNALSAGARGRLHPLHGLLRQPACVGRASQGAGLRLLGQRDDLRERGGHRQRQGVRRTGWRRTSSRTPTGWASCT